MSRIDGVGDRGTTGGRVAGLLEEGARLHRSGKWSAAIAKYEEVARDKPDHAKAHHLWGLALLGRHGAGDLERAIGHLLHAIRLDDSRAEFHNDLGSAYWNQRRIGEAKEAFIKAAALSPCFVQPHFNLGNCHWLLGSFGEALKEYERTTEIDPGWAQAHYMAANCLLYLGRTAESLQHYDAAIKQRGDLVDAYVGKATALLKLGEWAQGWRCFERRVEYPEFSAFRLSERPVWNGETANQESLLVYGEQGIGDVIQFVRFLRLAGRRVGRLMLVCDQRLHTLLRGQCGIDVLVDKDDFVENPDLIQFDKKVLLMSLPAIFGSTPDSVHGQYPYLQVEKERVDRWRQSLNPRTVNVGLVWAGNPAQKDDRFRSCPFSALKPLESVRGASLYALQKDEARAQLDATGGPAVTDLGDGLTDFREAAAAINALDLVISVDTAAAHIAGALGKPVWTILWHGHCWRYMEGSDTTPWYPSMRLFRQRAMGDWDELVTRVTERLGEFVANAEFTVAVPGRN